MLYDPLTPYRCARCGRPQYIRYLRVVLFSGKNPRRGEHVECKSAAECQRSIDARAGLRPRRQRS